MKCVQAAPTYASMAGSDPASGKDSWTEFEL